MVILVFVIVLIVTVVLFSVQNASPVAVTFLFWSFNASLAIVIFLSLLSGVIIGAVIALWSRRRTRTDHQPSKESPPPDPDASGTMGF